MESNYYREPGGPGPDVPYQTDKIIGIIIMVLSACCTVGAGMMIAGVGALASMMAAGAAQEGGAQAGEAGAAAAAVTGVAALAGIFMLISGILGVVVGYGIMKSLKWGFLVGAIVFGLSAISEFATMAIVPLIIHGALTAYCILRLTGKVGPPVA